MSPWEDISNRTNSGSRYGDLTNLLVRRRLGRVRIPFGVQTLTSFSVVCLLALALGTGFLSLCLPNDPGGPAYYDGDDDDVGIVQERAIAAFPLAVAVTLVSYVASHPRHWAVQRKSSGRPSIPLAFGLAPRAPPSA